MEYKVKNKKIGEIQEKISVLNTSINKAKNKLSQIEKIIEKNKEREYDLQAEITDKRTMVKNLEKFIRDLK